MKKRFALLIFFSLFLVSCNAENAKESSSINVDTDATSSVVISSVESTTTNETESLSAEPTQPSETQIYSNSLQAQRMTIDAIMIATS